MWYFSNLAMNYKDILVSSHRFTGWIYIYKKVLKKNKPKDISQLINGKVLKRM